MSDSEMAPAGRSAGQTQESDRLKKGQADWKHIAIMGIAGSAPAAVLALNLPFMGQFAGPAMVLAFVVVWVAVLLIMNTFVQFAKKLPTSGGLYTWNARAWGPNVGLVYGWLFAGTYLILTAGGFAVLGGFFHEYLLTQFSINLPWWIISAAGLGFAAGLGALGIAPTLRALVLFLGLEFILLLALAFWIFISVGPSGWSLEPLNPGSVSSSGAAGFGLALTYAILSLVGLEEGATLGEEAREPTRQIPKGLWVAAIVTPAFYVVTFYGMAIGYPSAMNEIPAEFTNDLVPLQTVAEHFWGSVGLSLIAISATISILAFAQAAFNAASRVLYTLGREGVLPRSLGVPSPRRQTPARAVWVVAVICIVTALPVSILSSPFDTWGYFGYLIGLTFLLSYIVTNAGMIKWARKFRDFHPIRQGLLPALGLLVLLYPLYKNIVPWPEGVYSILPLVVVGWIILGLIFLAWTRARRPEIIEEIGSTLALGEATDIEGGNAESDSELVSGRAFDDR